MGGSSDSGCGDAPGNLLSAESLRPGPFSKAAGSPPDASFRRAPAPTGLGASRPSEESLMTQLATRTPQARRRPSGGETVPADVAVDALLDIVDDKAWLRADGYLPGP